ncbi:blastula protease 10-like isoform X2 [Homarus americanus]|uniref:blastula protease 10-like isoform X2 n=1 Tax=Homarus americanus TaxID=6706 RepID=UPI001C470116|nr:blastula protease 10-like isoform X2 [Homarus americanus]
MVLLVRWFLASASFVAIHAYLQIPNGNYGSGDEFNEMDLFGDDIILNEEQRRAIWERKAYIIPSSRWPEGSDGNPLVPYRYLGLPSGHISAIQAGINSWMEHTCIKFEETTNTNQSHIIFILGSGCSSYIGMQSSNGQYISIGNGCQFVGTVVHEIFHALGCFHEQSSTNRDDYVNVHYENIISTKIYNFNKHSTAIVSNYGLPYDLSSVMHYGSKYFTWNGKLTITTNDPLHQGIIGQRSGLSFYDKLLANRMYNCTDKWLTACGFNSDPCNNDGYIGSNCKCVCRPGTTGNYCETIIGGYYDGLLSPCTEVVTQPGIITSPNFPDPYPKNEKCTKIIRAPDCYLPMLKFNFFHLYPMTYSCNQACCYVDILEIRVNGQEYGDVYCDKDISPGDTFVSVTNEIILYFQTKSNLLNGWSATVSFIPIPGCLPSYCTS